MGRQNIEGRKRGEAKCVFVPLSREVGDIVDAAAAQLGLTRSNLARVLIVNFAALVREKKDPFAAFAAITRLMSEAAVTPPTAADVEVGGSMRGNEPGLLKEAEVRGESG